MSPTNGSRDVTISIALAVAFHLVVQEICAKWLLKLRQPPRFHLASHKLQTNLAVHKIITEQALILLLQEIQLAAYLHQLKEAMKIRT